MEHVADRIQPQFPLLSQFQFWSQGCNSIISKMASDMDWKRGAEMLCSARLMRLELSARCWLGFVPDVSTKKG